MRHHSVIRRTGSSAWTFGRREFLAAVPLLGLAQTQTAPAPTIATVIGSGRPGGGNGEVNNPYGVVLGPDGALHFCDLDNHRIRRLDLRTKRTDDVAGNGVRGYAGDGGPATAGSINGPHEIAFDGHGNLFIVERDNHVVRRVEAGTGRLSTVAGTGSAGFAGDGGPATQAPLRQPHSIAFLPDGRLLVCDTGNHRLRVVDLSANVIQTIGGTGERLPSPDGAPLRGAPLNGPRATAIDRDGSIYLALREGNAIYRIAPATRTLHHVAGTGHQGYAGDGGPARLAALAGPKGLALAGRRLYLADTESHTIRCIDLDLGIITTVVGTGERGDGPDGDPRRCRLSRPHGLFATGDGRLYIGDSEAHRIRVLSE